MACNATHQADAVPSIPDMLAGGKMSPCERGSRIESTAISLDDVFVPPHQETCLGILWGRSAQDDARTSEFGAFAGHGQDVGQRSGLRTGGLWPEDFDWALSKR